MSLIPRVDGDDVTPRQREGYDVNPTPKGDDEVAPDPCTTPFDAITVIRTEVFLFIGKVRKETLDFTSTETIKAY